MQESERVMSCHKSKYNTLNSQCKRTNHKVSLFLFTDMASCNFSFDGIFSLFEIYLVFRTYVRYGNLCYSVGVSIFSNN